MTNTQGAVEILQLELCVDHSPVFKDDVLQVDGVDFRTGTCLVDIDLVGQQRMHAVYLQPAHQGREHCHSPQQRA